MLTAIIKLGEQVPYMPGPSRCCTAQNQVWDLLLLVPSPLDNRGELIAKVCVGVHEGVKQHCHRVP